MAALSREWGPTTNLFDPVVFFVFVSDGDDNTGCTYHPKANYTLPSNFGKWDYMFQCNGWGQAYYSYIDATKDDYGKAVTPGPKNDPIVNWTDFKTNTSTEKKQ